MELQTDVNAAPVHGIVTMPFTPYYDEDGITIYNSDCRKVMPWIGEIDLLLTDPPYGIDAGNTQFGKADGYEKGDWDKTTDELAIKLAMERTKTAIVFGGNYYTLPPAVCWLVWDKKNECTTFADCELAWTNMKRAVRKFEWLWSGPYQQKREHRVHPTQKPLALMRWCLSLVPEAQTVLDPFMGSGTTLVAARLEGRKAIGIEISEKYCEAAVKRLAQKTLF